MCVYGTYLQLIIVLLNPQFCWTMEHHHRYYNTHPFDRALSAARFSIPSSLVVADDVVIYRALYCQFRAHTACRCMLCHGGWCGVVLVVRSAELMGRCYWCGGRWGTARKHVFLADARTYIPHREWINTLRHKHMRCTYVPSIALFMPATSLVYIALYTIWVHQNWTHDDQYSRNILANVVLTGFQRLIE